MTNQRAGTKTLHSKRMALACYTLDLSQPGILGLIKLTQVRTEAVHCSLQLSKRTCLAVTGSAGCRDPDGLCACPGLAGLEIWHVLLYMFTSRLTMTPQQERTAELAGQSRA